MSKIISIAEEKKELVIKHESEIKKSTFWSGLALGTITFMLFVLLIMDLNIGFFVLLLSSIAALHTVTSSKVQNNIIVKIDKKHFTIERNSKYLYQPEFERYQLPVSNIKRIYLVRARNSDIISIYSTQIIYCYEIWGEKHNGSKTRILGAEEGFFVEKESQARIVMDRMTAFLQGQELYRPAKIRQIEARYTKEELQNSPRAIEKEENITKMTIKDLTKGVLVDYHDETWEVIGQIQYDWKQGNTDSLYQLSNAKNAAMLLLVSQDMAIYTTSIEERLSHYDLVKHQLDKVHQEAPLKFVFNDITFFKERVERGYEFVATDAQGDKIKQWKYLSEDKQHSLRILKHEDDDIFAFLGKKIEKYEFSAILIA